MTITEIETSLQNATQIGFHPTPNYEKEPPLVMLGFDNPRDGTLGYNGLLDKFQNSEVTLILFRKYNQKHLDISLVSKKSADAINIKNLLYDSSNLDNFMAKEPVKRKFILVIGDNPATGNQVVMTREPFSPLVLDKYEVIGG